MTKEARNLRCATYTVTQFARLAGIGRNQAYEAVRRKEVPSIRIGKRILIPAAGAERLLGIQPAGAELSAA